MGTPWNKAGQLAVLTAYKRSANFSTTAALATSAGDKGMAQKAWETVKDKAQSAKETVIGTAQTAKDTVIDKTHSAKDIVMDKAHSAKETILGEKSLNEEQARKDAKDTVKNFGKTLGETKEPLSNVGKTMGDAWDKTKDKSKGTYEGVADKAKELREKAERKLR